MISKKPYVFGKCGDGGRYCPCACHVQRSHTIPSGRSDSGTDEEGHSSVSGIAPGGIASRCTRISTSWSQARCVEAVRKTTYSSPKNLTDG